MLSLNGVLSGKGKASGKLEQRSLLQRVHKQEHDLRIMQRAMSVNFQTKLS